MVWKMCEGSERRNREMEGSSNRVWIATARCKKTPTMRATEKKRQTHESKARKLLGNGHTSALNDMEKNHGSVPRSVYKRHLLGWTQLRHLPRSTQQPTVHSLFLVLPAKTSSILVELFRKNRPGKCDWIAEFHMTCLEGGKHTVSIVILTLLSTLYFPCTPRSSFEQWNGSTIPFARIGSFL
jgi:hypothetical protein